jgi:hypothetical protein
MEIRDPIYGFIELTEQEASILGHRVLQRLRRISQLAMTYLVYPSARHSRFEHSLGVMRIAEKVAKRLRLKEEERICIKLAGLLHDVGHGPFSHVSEIPLAKLSEESLRGSGIQLEKVHELITIDIINFCLFQERLINNTQWNLIKDMLHPSSPPSIKRDIVSGPLDADKMDYLLRDSYFCGVRYGTYDLERFIQALVKVTDYPEDHVGVNEEDIPSVDQYILAKHFISLQVYRHKIRRITDAMLTRSILLAAEEGNSLIRTNYSYKPDSPEYIKSFLRLDDEALLKDISDMPSNSKARELVLRLRDRRLLKEVFCEKMPCGSENFQRKVEQIEDQEDWKRTLEQNIGDSIGVCSHSVFIELVRSKPLRKSPQSPEAFPELIRVKPQVSDGKSLDYDKVSQFFRHGGLKGDDYFYVYAPIDEESKDKKERKRQEVRKKIEDVICSI